MLFYADGLRQALWDWLFRKFPKGNINVPDEELGADVLVRDTRKLTSAFLTTIGARVLRILDSEEPRISDVRPRSFAPGEETHGTTPSELCSNLGISLARILKIVKVPSAAAEPLRFIDPKSRTTTAEYGVSGTTKPDRDRIVEWILGNFLYSEIDRTKHGTFSSVAMVSLARRTSEIVAINITLSEIESEERPVNKNTGWDHIITVVRINDAWYVADNEVGVLMSIQTPAGGPFSPEIIEELESPYRVYFELRYTRSRGGGDEYPEAQYFLRDLSGNILASTRKMPMLAREPVPGVRPVVQPKIMREMYGIQDPGGRVVVPQPRTMVYWKRPSRSSGPTTDWTSIVARPEVSAPSPAGSGERVATVADFLRMSAGKRKTRKTKKKRRKTSRAGRARPSLPK